MLLSGRKRQCIANLGEHGIGKQISSGNWRASGVPAAYELQMSDAVGADDMRCLVGHAPQRHNLRHQQSDWQRDQHKQPSRPSRLVGMFDCCAVAFQTFRAVGCQIQAHPLRAFILIVSAYP